MQWSSLQLLRCRRVSRCDEITPQSQCKPSAESSLFAEVQPDFAVSTAKVQQNPLSWHIRIIGKPTQIIFFLPKFGFSLTYSYLWLRRKYFRSCVPSVASGKPSAEKLK